jgi:DNA polymerase-3 subunit alpha
MRALVDRRPGSEETNLIVQELFPLTELSARFTNGVVIRVREDTQGDAALAKLREIARGYPGPKPLKLHLVLADGGCVALDCSKSGVTLDPEFRRRVDELLGPGNFKLIGGAKPKAAAPIASNGKRRAFARS